ncbi:AzlD domain-containing protein [Aneurinibacillus tyrosinisolvens]|uniref:AzlD domain-containing protein n=1 Tax=Aneurinibacillus tyrosinisolvens TaxID=1443435 RepID=UPI00063F0AA5|nr:AzlD domain-containing protein [Aneurinibacillus tyrosinisolvens]
MNLQLILLVAAMGAVTYIPRMVPMVLLQNVQLPPFLYRFFRFIPFAALGALIFPGILFSTGDNNIDSGIVGTIVCAALAFFRLNVMLVVLGGIAAVFLWEMFIQ